MTTTDQLPTSPPVRSGASPAPQPPERAPFRRRNSARLRITLWYVVLLTLALGFSVVAVRQVLLAGMAERIEAALTQEAEELRNLASGVDPADGRPFGARVERIFEVFLRRNIPADNETMLTLVDGEPYLRSAGRTPVLLENQTELVERWRAVEAVDRSSAVLPEVGRIEFLAVPLQIEGATEGVFVVAIFADLERREVDEVVRTAILAGAIALALASLLAWGLASRLLEPVRNLTRTATSISESDLTQRIAVQGNDEIAELAATFNAMLDRIEQAFTTQRHFIDDAGHELRTPITIIRGHLELLEDDPAERAETVALVLDELDRMNRMVEDLLLLAKAQHPDFLDLQTVDVGALVDAVAAKAQALARRDWTTELRARGMVVADRQRLTQALVQLAQNATQHTADGDVIALGSAIADGQARLWVRDTGPGIPLEEQERIFERFTRGRDGRRRSEGAGLGLSIVRAIAEAHHGRLDLTSRPGAGATFTIVMPVDQPVREEPG